MLVRVSAVPGRRERGSALIIGLVLLAVITLLAVAGMNASTMDLQVASNVQATQNSFQASERALAIAMNATIADTTQAAVNVPAQTVPGTNDQYKFSVSFNAQNGVSEVPPESGEFSLGEGVGFKAYHFDVTATGTSARDASSSTTQSYYVVGPSGG